MDILTVITAGIVGIVANIIYDAIKKYLYKSRNEKVSVKLPTGMTYEIDSPKNGVGKFNKRISSFLYSTAAISIEMTEGVRLLEDIVLPCVSIFKDSLSGKNIKLTIGDIKGLPPVKADVKALQQVVFNLLDNAIKYSLPDGTINVDGEVKKQFVELTISNPSSMKLHPEEIENIFELGYRGQEAALNSKTRSGIGLFVAKSLIEKHAGKISAEAHEHLFTTKILLPIKQHPTNLDETMAKAG